MAKTALKNKAAAKPKFKVRAYTRCQVCGRPHSVYRKFGLCRICLCRRVRTGCGDRSESGGLRFRRRVRFRRGLCCECLAVCFSASGVRR